MGKIKNTVKEIKKTASKGIKKVSPVVLKSKYHDKKETIEVQETKIEIQKEEGEAYNSGLQIALKELEEKKGEIWVLVSANLELRVKLNKLYQLYQRDEIEINELYANEIAQEIEKVFRENNLITLQNKLNTANAHLQIFLNGWNEVQKEKETLHNQLQENKKKNIDHIKCIRSHFQYLLNQARETNQNLQIQVNQTEQIQQQLDQQRIIELETENDTLQDQLAATTEQRSNYRSQRSQRTPQWRDSEITLSGIEEENQGGSSNSKNSSQTQNSSNWKSSLWNTTKKWGITALAAYGSYQGGHYQGSSSSNQLQLNCSTNLITSPVVAVNATHSWPVNPLTDFSIPVIEQNSPVDFNPKIIQLNHDLQLWTNQFPDLDPEEVKKGYLELEQDNLNLNATLDEKEKLIKSLEKNQKPLDLPQNWRRGLKSIPGLKNSTRELTDQVKRLEKERDARPNINLLHYSELVNRPNITSDEWEKDYSLRPTQKELEDKQKVIDNLTTQLDQINDNWRELKDKYHTEITKLLAQIPTGLPLDWKIKLRNIQEQEKNANQTYQDGETVEPGIADKISLESVAGGTILGYLAEKYLQKQSSPKIEHEEEKKKLKDLTEKLAEAEKAWQEEIDEMEDEIEELKQKNKDLTIKLSQEQENKEKFKNDLEKSEADKGSISASLQGEISALKGKLADQKKDMDTLTHQRDKAREKLKDLKENYQTLVQSAQTNLTTLALVKYQPESDEEDTTDYAQSLQKNTNLLVNEFNNLQLQIAQHTCPPCKLQHCSHYDYELLSNHTCPKTCSEAYHQKIRLERERKVISQINNECKLGCSPGGSLSQLISKIKELISPPGVDLALVIQLEKESMQKLLSPTLFAAYDEKLKQVDDYQDLATQRSDILQELLNQEKQQLTAPKKGGWITPQTIFLGGLVLMLTVGGLLVLKKRNLPSGKSSLGKAKLSPPSFPKLPTLHQIKQYLVDNQIKFLEIDEQGSLITKFKV